MDGVGEVRVVERGRGKVLVSVAPGEEVKVEEMGEGDGRVGRFKGVKIDARGVVCGTGFAPVAGMEGRVARIKVKEGLWEVKRGRKIHGGERRRKNVLSRIAAKARGTLK